MLLQEERYIIKWLSQYGALPKTQILRLLKDKPASTTEKIIRNLIRESRISEVGGYYLGLDEMCKPDQRMILAVWILLQFNEVDPLAHYPAVYPAQIYFLKQNIGYEIVVLYEGEQHLTKLLQPQEELKYILVLPHISMAQSLYIPNVPHLFATIDYEGKEEPHVTFYSEEVKKT